MATDFRATFWNNFTKVTTFFLAVALLLSEITMVDSRAIDKDPFGYCSLLLITAFMLVWSITDWNTVEQESEPETESEEEPEKEV